MESLGSDDVSIVLLLIIIIIRSSSSYNRGHNLLKHLRKTQHKLIRLMKTSIASLNFPQCWFHEFTSSWA